MTNLKLLSEGKGTNIKLDIAPDIEIDCDPDDLDRLISNLVENAIRYTDANGAVHIHATRQGTAAILKVEDNGIGIAQDDQEKVYDRFWRADKARNYEDGNQGLGLAIVKALVERYQGNISVQSELGKGSVFTVSLPTASLHRANVSEQST